MECGTGTVKYKIKEKNVFMSYNCTNASNVIIIGKGSGYGTINITSDAWNNIKNLEIRHVGTVSIEGKADTNSRNSIVISSCDELYSSTATHWGVTTIFESIKKVTVKKIIGGSGKNSIVSNVTLTRTDFNKNVFRLF